MSGNRADNIKIIFKTFRHDTETYEDEKTEEEYEGVMKKIGDTTYVMYEETDPDDKKVTKNLLKISRDRLERECSGEKKSVMVFKAGSETRTSYKTPYGTFHLRFTTTYMDIAENDSGTVVSLEYMMSYDNGPVADCRMEIILKQS